MFDTFSPNNRISFGHGPQPGYGYGYPQPGPGYPPQTGFGPPPPYKNNNPFGAPAPQPQSTQGYPHDKKNQNSTGFRGENASYYGTHHVPVPSPASGPGPVPPRSHGPSPVPLPHFNGGPSPGPGRYPSPTPYSAPQPSASPIPAAAPGPAPMQMQMQNAPRSLILKQSPETHKIIHIHASGSGSGSSAPLYSLTSSPKNSKADYVLARGADPNASRTETAFVKSHTFSSKYDLVVRGKTCVLKWSTSGSNYKIEVPGMGTYKWHTDQENLSSKMWLKDASGMLLATYDKSRQKSSVGVWKKFVGGKDREVTLNVPLDGFLVEVLLVSLYAVKMAKEGAMEAAVEIVGAVAGA